MYSYLLWTSWKTLNERDGNWQVQNKLVEDYIQFTNYDYVTVNYQKLVILWLKQSSETHTTVWQHFE